MSQMAQDQNRLGRVDAKTFVSYAREDAEFVLKLAEELRQAGANIWVDQLDIPPGARWDRAVEQALEECPRMLVILSPASVSSNNVLDEVHYALDEEKSVIPALYRECKIPLRLRRLQRVDVGAGVAGLLKVLGVKRETPPPTSGTVKAKPEVEQALAELPDEATTHVRRPEIGQRLAEIGDPQRGMGIIDGVPEILWRPIPGGEVEVEGRGRLRVEPFSMAAYPITVGQFLAFLEAKDGYEDERWWKDLEREDRHPAWQSKPVKHPVTHVSWYDATAFCRWLSRRLRFEMRLPDEHEWQWAAQSARADFKYPWGPEWRDGCANTFEAGVHATTEVGAYPQGDSLQKVSDLAGNVWEWCRNKYEKPEVTAPGGEESRVLRGGSWRNALVYARAVARDFDLPDLRSGGFGFRVVCSAPIR